MSDRDKAVNTLQELFDYARLEQQIATRQSVEAREVKDFRAMDRHAAYAQAMQKMHQKINDIARNQYLHNVNAERELSGVSNNATLNNEACDSERKPCNHIVIDCEDSAECCLCGKDFGWFCPSGPKSYCEYTSNDECCIHCGAPEERQ